MFESLGLWHHSKEGEQGNQGADGGEDESISASWLVSSPVEVSSIGQLSPVALGGALSAGNAVPYSGHSLHIVERAEDAGGSLGDAHVGVGVDSSAAVVFSIR